MERAVSELRQKFYDIVVVGGGVYGASVARDAAMRGLRVALVDQGDFGSVTSANSHKIIHGGLRYLQHGHIPRMRESIRERSTLMRVAPHLVTPMPFLIPTYKSGGPGKWIMKVALTLNDCIGFDRNHHLPSDKRIPNGRIVSKEECLVHCPGLELQGLTGGAIFHDAQIYNAERYVLSVCRSAAGEGADLANFVRATDLIQENNRVIGLKVVDVLTGESFKIGTTMVVNCGGPRCASIMRGVKHEAKLSSLRWIKALVLVTRSLARGIAVGVPSQYQVLDSDALVNKGHRYFFITPWRDRSLVGTFQTPHNGTPETFQVDPKEVDTFVQEIQSSFPRGNLQKGDIKFVYAGLLPMAYSACSNEERGDGQFLKSYILCDHKKHDGLDGLVSVVGVKFTTARDVAEKAVDLVIRKLGRPIIRSKTAWVPVYGGDVGQFGDFISHEIKMKPKEIDVDVMSHLLKNYGAKYRDVLDLGSEEPSLLERVSEGSVVIKAEIVHGIRQEMALHLSDVVMRRTELGTAGFPGIVAVRNCATVMARERSWNADEMEYEIETILDAYRKVGCNVCKDQETVCVS